MEISTSQAFVLSGRRSNAGGTRGARRGVASGLSRASAGNVSKGPRFARPFHQMDRISVVVEFHIQTGLSIKGASRCV